MNWIRKLLGFSHPRRQAASQASPPSGPEDALRKQKAAMDPYGPESLEDMWVAARHLCRLLTGRKDIVDIAPGNRFGEGVIVVLFHPDSPIRPDGIPHEIDGWRVFLFQASHQGLGNLQRGRDPNPPDDL